MLLLVKVTIFNTLSKQPSGEWIQFYIILPREGFRVIEIAPSLCKSIYEPLKLHFLYLCSWEILETIIVNIYLLCLILICFVYFRDLFCNFRWWLLHQESKRFSSAHKEYDSCNTEENAYETWDIKYPCRELYSSNILWFTQGFLDHKWKRFRKVFLYILQASPWFFRNSLTESQGEFAVLREVICGLD